jgi:hypothetical protein
MMLLAGVSFDIEEKEQLSSLINCERNEEKSAEKIGWVSVVVRNSRNEGQTSRIHFSTGTIESKKEERHDRRETVRRET